jgi:hypothetical protein
MRHWDRWIGYRCTVVTGGEVVRVKKDGGMDVCAGCVEAGDGESERRYRFEAEGGSIRASERIQVGSRPGTMFR